MKISDSWLSENFACSEGCDWFHAQTETDGVKVVKKLLVEDKWEWANWTFVRLMTHKQKVQYAVFAAEQVIKIFEDKYPDDDRPRKAIEAAKKWIKNPTGKDRGTAGVAWATSRAAWAAEAAARAAWATARATSRAAGAVEAAAWAAWATKKKIIEFGISLLE